MRPLAHQIEVERRQRLSDDDADAENGLAQVGLLLAVHDHVQELPSCIVDCVAVSRAVF